ncbi:MAG TPA: amidase [Thermoanaerobaculia bacterium]|nr:amidase [Thermoanaerobaculia bacterium]
MGSRLTRRAFVTSGAVGVVGGVLAANGFPDKAEAAPAEPPPPPAPAPFELEEMTISQLQEGMKAGKYTARQLVEKYLARIEELDSKGPALHAVLETNPDALSIADTLDAERKAKGVRGPLHGIPILIKDNIGTADKMETTAGSLALVGGKPQRDAFVAARLRAAGAILLGKTNLSEWANFRSTHSSSGWSGRGGQCRNPYALDRTPSGSSSGSGAGAAANFAAAAVGSETDGSILSPSAASSLVGIKPTLGLLSRAGIIPIAHSQDTAGPMARTVADAAILLGAMTGVDERDTATRESRGKGLSDYAKFLDPHGLKGARIGVARKKLFGYSAPTDHVIEAALAVLKDQGAILVDPADIATVGKFDDTELLVLLYEFKADLNKYLAELGPGAPVHTLAEIIEWNRKNREREMPFFGQEIMLMAEKKGPLTSAEYKKALAKNHLLSRAKGIDATLAKHKLDAIVAPTQGPAWLIDLVNGDSGAGGSSTTPPAVAGYPSITVPAGFAAGLPIGISFMGPAWSEGKLIQLAYAFEQATKVRRPPQFRPSADLSGPLPVTA